MGLVLALLVLVSLVLLVPLVIPVIVPLIVPLLLYVYLLLLPLSLLLCYPTQSLLVPTFYRTPCPRDSHLLLWLPCRFLRTTPSLWLTT